MDRGWSVDSQDWWMLRLTKLLSSPLVQDILVHATM